MSFNLKELIQYMASHNHTFFAHTPVVYHCHHFNLFLDQTIDDALGSKQGLELRTHAPQEPTYNLLESICHFAKIKLPLDRIQVASTVFAAMGHGSLHFSANQRGGTVRGDYTHYGFSWKDKYGKAVRRTLPADAFGAGYAAAAVEVAYDLPLGSLKAEETTCIATGAPNCEFTLSPSGTTTKRQSPVRLNETKKALKTVFHGDQEETIANIAQGLVQFLGTLSTDERGLLQGFGVFVTMHLAEYYNRISYDAFYHITKQMPQSTGVMGGLLRESGHVCVFNTFGGILNSPEWEGLVGPITGNPLDIIVGCCAIGRALGFGHWTIHDFAPNQSLTLRTPSTYESNYHVNRHEMANEGRCFFFQGASLAMMQLAHRVDWKSKPDFDQDLYNDLFRRGVPWVVEETKCISKGDEFCETQVHLR